MARAEDARRLLRSRWPLVLAVAVVVLAGAGVGSYFAFGRSSSTPSAAPASTPTTTTTPAATTPAAPRVATNHLSGDALALAGLTGRTLQFPECKPLKGPVWKYPYGPPVPGLPPLQANITSNLYEVFSINLGCATADRWIEKFVRMTVPVLKNGNPTALKGPAGFVCAAWPDAHGHAYAGGCQPKGLTGNCAVPKNGIAQAGGPATGNSCVIVGKKQAFGWNWNVANRRVVFAHNAAGVLRLFHVSGADTNVIFRYLKGKYELDVLNTSGIGYLNGFTWKPSPGWKVTAVSSAKGIKCSVAHGGGQISCKGTVDPPSCLCTGDGGEAIITFTAAPTTKKSGYLFGGGAAQFKITQMTPVPYIIPGTPDEAKKRDGV